MSQFPHDEFAKNLFELLLTPFGGVQVDKLPELAKALLRFGSIDDLALWLTNNQ